MNILDKLNHYPHSLLGAAELSSLLGITPQNLANRVRRGLIVTPDCQLRATPVWRLQSLIAWARSPQTSKRAEAVKALALTGARIVLVSPTYTVLEDRERRFIVTSTGDIHVKKRRR